MNMIMSVRKNPIICLLLSLGRLLVGKLTYSKEYVGTPITMNNGEEYHIFRHITSLPQHHDEQGSLLIVRFKFARLSQKVNTFVSQFPCFSLRGFQDSERKCMR